MVTLIKEDSSTAEESSAPFEDDESSSSSSSSSSSESSNAILSDAESSYTMISSQSMDDFEDEKEMKYFLAYLKKLKQRKGKEYVETIKSLQTVIDREVDREPIELSLQEKCKQFVSSDANCIETSFLDMFIQQLQFEAKYFLPTAIALVAYCVAHVSLYEILNTVISEASKSSDMSSHVIYICLIMAGFALARFSGSAWYWLNEDLWSGAKIELRKRVKMGFLDTKVQLWFKKHKLLRSGVGLLSFYLCHIGMVYFVCYVLFPYVGDDKEYYLSNLPSQKYHNSSTFVSQELIKAINGTSSDGAHACEITQDDFDFMFDKMTIASFEWFFGRYDTALVTAGQTLLFYAVVAVCSITILKKLKVGLD